jgi:hypothetical protein
MNLKTKVFGFAVATALSLGIAASAMAAPGDMSVTLQDGDPCFASIASGEIDFGSHKWDGTTYEEVTAPSGSIDVEVTNSEYDVDTCDVTLGVSDLSGVNGGSISSADILLDGADSTNSYTVAAAGSGSQNVTATLNADKDTFVPDVYSGTITVDSYGASA